MENASQYMVRRRERIFPYESRTAHDDARSKRQQKDWRLTVLGTVREEFTEVNSDGHPTAPKHVVKGYSIQLGCILRSTASINTENLRHKDRGNLRNLLFTKLTEVICAISSSQS